MANPKTMLASKAAGRARPLRARRRLSGQARRARSDAPYLHASEKECANIIVIRYNHIVAKIIICSFLAGGFSNEIIIPRCKS